MKTFFEREKAERDAKLYSSRNVNPKALPVLPPNLAERIGERSMPESAMPTPVATQVPTTAPAPNLSTKPASRMANEESDRA